MRALRSIAVLALLLQTSGALAAQSEEVLPTADPGATREAIARGIEAVIDRAPVDQTHWGVIVVDLDSGDTLYARNARRKFIPASNMKVLVTAASLWTFGRDHRFRTEIHAVGDRNGDALRGDLVLLPSGDPTWSRRWYEDDPDTPLRDLAAQVAASGLSTVSGDLVVAAARWDSTSAPSSWMRGNIPWGFSAVPAPMALEDATTSVVVRAGTPGEPAEIDWSPRAIPDFVESRVRTVPAADTTAEIDAFWLPESGLHRLEGSIREGRVDTIEVSTRIPTEEARLRLVDLLAESGVDLLHLPSPESAAAQGPSSGEALEPSRPRAPILWAEGDSLPQLCDPVVVAWCDLAEPIASFESAPMIDIVKNALEPSQNWITEQLLRALALERAGLASWGNGTDAVVAVLAERAGVDTLDLALRDGSGLSAYNLVTPRALVAILAEMDRGDLADAWRDALAAPGEEDSTLQYRLAGLEDRVQAKTGTISNVNSLSGYVRTDSGRRLAFSILTNGSGLPSGPVRRSIDSVVRVLAGL